MGTHPIFESDFDCLTEMKLILTAAFSSALADFKPRQKMTKGETCMYLADGIEAQMTRTRKQNFGGGNTKWEEKKLGKWATSETRMLEVMESACGEGYGSIDLNSMNMDRAGANADCYSMLERNENWIEDWFEADPDAKGKNFYEDFCVKKLKFCCPGRDEFGKKCKKCPVDADGKVCSGNGICVGAGDKEGIGGCKCNDHFAGWKCHECHEDYFMSKGECHKCHKSCKTCTGPKSKDCKACGSHYRPRQLSDGTFECKYESEHEKYRREEEEKKSKDEL